ncbi:DUF2254 domain-containing protein [Rossellomorea vietnamensis]|uniref:DUF2254 domain-containing protein n=1 Tax=Rossellomorea vietnamensis TaxID=218284 RepID=A0A6I6UVC5_9BACI|nr:DUF2254 domain-containing protein [Rossellomorea vietnamensis]QHE63062.1 DUF2254 domain-containing protein [Rossellomorea vietnamensis]
MLKKFLPLSIQKYLLMSKRQRMHEIRLTIWYMPFIYICLSLFMVAITLYLDLYLEVSQYTFDLLSMDASVTRILVSTLIGGILTLSAFTLNSLLVVLTMFSGQFSPRMLLDFISDKQTQHALGIFNGSFVYVLLLFLFIGSSKKEMFVAAPLMTIGLAFLSALTFIFFINHASTWMQVHNITYNMKQVSEVMINQTLKKDLETHRTADHGDFMEEEKRNIIHVTSRKSGYIQLVDFQGMIRRAHEENFVLQLHYKVGDFVLAGNELMSLWGPETDYISTGSFLSFIEMGHKETEIQDLQMGIHKLAEVAIKSLGNDDPKTASNTIHQMADLMLTVEDQLSFSPYLIDHQKRIRVILQSEPFDYYLYRGFGYIRHYAKDNHLIITEIVRALALLAESIQPSKHNDLWEFACNTIDHIEREVIYELDKSFLLQEVHKLARLTQNLEEYEKIETKFYPAANENT